MPSFKEYPEGRIGLEKILVYLIESMVTNDLLYTESFIEKRIIFDITQGFIGVRQRSVTN